MEVGSIASFNAQNVLSGVDQVSRLAERSSEQSVSFADLLTKSASSADSETTSAGLPAPSSLLTPTSKNTRIDKTDKLYEQCEALETFMLKILVNGMRKTIQKSELMSGGFAGDMYEDMLYDEYAKEFSKNARFGFADQAYLELTGQRGKVMADRPV